MPRCSLPLLLPPPLLLLTLLSIILPSTSAHFVDPTVAAFPINPESASESHTVRLPSPSPFTCTFTHTTVPPVPDTSERAKRFNMADWLSAMSGQGECVKTTSNYWEYEVCVLASVRQWKGMETYSLGKERVVKEMSLVFKGGDQCTTQAYKGPRETTVTFACDPTSTTPHLTSINEASTCHYEMALTTPAVCGDSRFPTLTPGALTADTATEDWFMEITPLHGHDAHTALATISAPSHPVEAMCAVYSLEPRAKKSELRFTQWELRIDRWEEREGVEVDEEEGGMEQGGHAVRQAEAPLVAVRHPGRRVMGEDEFEVEFTEDAHSVRNTRLFNGQLAYVKLYA